MIIFDGWKLLGLGILILASIAYVIYIWFISRSGGDK